MERILLPDLKLVYGVLLSSKESKLSDLMFCLADAFFKSEK
jgi:hypothetical protein